MRGPAEVVRKKFELVCNKQPTAPSESEALPERIAA